MMQIDEIVGRVPSSGAGAPPSPKGRRTLLPSRWVGGVLVTELFGNNLNDEITTMCWTVAPLDSALGCIHTRSPDAIG